jgi:L-cysteine desulfidase
MLAINDLEVLEDGILEKDLTKTVKNLEKIKEAMSDIDPTITQIMKEKALT